MKLNFLGKIAGNRALRFTLGTCARSAIAILIFSSLSCSSSPSPAEKVTFACEIENKIPTTVARTRQQSISIVRWVSDFGSQANYTPQKRCEEVSNRFQIYYDRGELNYITVGRQNNQNIICASRHSNSCSQLLLTLKPEDNPQRVIKQLFDVGRYATGPLEQSSGNSIAIDIRKLLRLNQ